MKSRDEVIAEIDAIDEIRANLFTVSEDHRDIRFNIPLILELFGGLDERSD